MEIGERIKLKREELNMSQDELAKNGIQIKIIRQ